MVILRNGHTLSDGKHCTVCYTGDLQLDVLMFVGTFNAHKGNTSKTTMTKTVIKILDKLLPLTGRQVGPLQSKILPTPLIKTTKVSSRLMPVMICDNHISILHCFRL